MTLNINGRKERAAIEREKLMKKIALVLLLVGIGYFGYQYFSTSGETALEPLYEIPYVVVYGQTTCSWTKKCLRELKAEGIDAIFENIDRQEVKMEIFPRIDQAGHPRNKIVIPIIDVNGVILVGYDHDKVLEHYYRNEAEKI